MTVRMIILETLQRGPMTVQEIAKHSGIKEGTVYGATPILEAKGLIEEHERRATGKNGPHQKVYRLRSTQ
jgi:DNA-binding PadR family transcriptional regulator